METEGVMLWHGTRGTDPRAVAMSMTGLDTRMSRSHVYGRAIYLTDNPLMAIHYAHLETTTGEDVANHPANCVPDCSHRWHVKTLSLLLCKVLPGNVYDADVNPAAHVWDTGARLPPEGYDSAVGTAHAPCKCKWATWAIYENARVYSAYIVTVQVATPCHPSARCGCPVALHAADKSFPLLK
jgi:hypothetical protein